MRVYRPFRTLKKEHYRKSQEDGPMSELPKVSVVIATRNRAAHLKRSLNRLFEDDYPNRELVIVDKASTDGTVDLLKSYGNRITRWVSEPDEGEYFAYNKALATSSGAIIKPMADDDLLRPGAIRLSVDYFANHPETDIVFGQTAYWLEWDGEPTLIRESHMTDPSRLTLHHWLHWKQGVESVAAFIRRRVFERIGPFSTVHSCGDLEFWARAARHGMTMGVMPQVVVDYYRSDFHISAVKWEELIADIICINREYGTSADVLSWVLRKYIWVMPVRLVAGLCHTIGIHPVRTMLKWRAKLRQRR